MFLVYYLANLATDLPPFLYIFTEVTVDQHCMSDLFFCRADCTLIAIINRTEVVVLVHAYLA